MGYYSEFVETCIQKGECHRSPYYWRDAENHIYWRKDVDLGLLVVFGIVAIVQPILFDAFVQ